MGFHQPVVVSGTVRRWLAGHPRGLKGETAQAQFAELAPLFIDHVARAENPDAALAAFDRFLGNLHGGARLFRCCDRIPIWWRWWRGCWERPRGLRIRSRCILTYSIR